MLSRAVSSSMTSAEMSTSLMARLVVSYSRRHPPARTDAKMSAVTSMVFTAGVRFIVLIGGCY